MEANTLSTAYRRDELDRFFSQRPFVDAFAEYRPSARTTFSIGAQNITGRKSYRERLFFRPDRISPSPVIREFRDRSRHIVPFLSIRHSFG